MYLSIVLRAKTMCSSRVEVGGNIHPGGAVVTSHPEGQLSQTVPHAVHQLTVEHYSYLEKDLVSEGNPLSWWGCGHVTPWKDQHWSARYLVRVSTVSTSQHSTWWCIPEGQLSQTGALLPLTPRIVPACTHVHRSLQFVQVGQSLLGLGHGSARWHSAHGTGHLALCWVLTALTLELSRHCQPSSWQPTCLML